MGTSPYSLFIHPDCIEGVQLVRRGDQYSIKRGYSSSFTHSPVDSRSEETSLFEKIDQFLEYYQWRDHTISLILPTNDVTFRALTFPFHNKKKINQILPFEIENEILEEIETISFQTIIKESSDATTKTLLASVQNSYLEALQSVMKQHHLHIRNIDCSAYALFKSAPISSSSHINLQVYLGPEEAFINAIEDQHLEIVKMFPNRISKFLKNFEGLHQIEIHDLPRLIQNQETVINKYPDLNNQQLQEVTSQIKDEIEWLCSQFNLFSRKWQIDGAIHVSLHGLFQGLIHWNEETFEWADGHSTEDRPSDSTQTVDSFAQITTTYWGILEELKEYGLNHLMGHELSFYSEETHWKSFIRGHRLMVCVGTVLFFLFVGGAGFNYYLQIQLLKKEIQITEQQINTKIKRLTPRISPQNIQQSIAFMENQIKEKKELSEETRFNQRSYKNLALLKKVSQLLPNASLKLDRLEFNDTRFAIKGSINNYKNLQILKNRIQNFTEFKGKKPTESNRPVSNGINFNISVNR